MAQGTPNVLQPPIASTVEVEPVMFDFGPLLSANYTSGTYITSVSGINVYVVAGTDPSPQSRTIGVPMIVTSVAVPTATQGAIVAWFGNMLPNVTYRLQAIAALSDGRSFPSIEVELPCYDPAAA
jgi:hypothetical protein